MRWSRFGVSRGTPRLLDYSSTKGAIVAFTRSLALSLVGKGIRVNGVAPGPIWTPLFLASDDASYMSGQVLHPNGGTIVNG
jgi:NAD(P)-dependent dehydrogenase (short-subunit alcohol dehydrogenase family)